MSQEGKYKINMVSANMETTARQKSLKRMESSNRGRGLNNSTNSFVAVFGLTIVAYYAYTYSINHLISYLILISLGYFIWWRDKSVNIKKNKKLLADLRGSDEIVIGDIVIDKREQKSRCSNCNREYTVKTSFCLGCGASFN